MSGLHCSDLPSDTCPCHPTILRSPRKAVTSACGLDFSGKRSDPKRRRSPGLRWRLHELHVPAAACRTKRGLHCKLPRLQAFPGIPGALVSQTWVASPRLATSGCPAGLLACWPGGLGA